MPALEVGAGLGSFQMKGRLPGRLNIVDLGAALEPASLSASWAQNASTMSGLWFAFGLCQRFPTWTFAGEPDSYPARRAHLTFGTDGIFVWGIRTKRHPLDLASVTTAGIDYGAPLATQVSQSLSNYVRLSGSLQLGLSSSLSIRSSLRGDPTPRVAAAFSPSIVLQPLSGVLIELYVTSTSTAESLSSPWGGVRMIALPQILSPARGP
ncbi:MAG: hypothetical protein ACO3JL_04835 [Myxococcota bacterium]